MVHHEWRQRGSINVQKTEAIQSGSSVSRFVVSSLRFLELVNIADRRASFPEPRVALFALEVLMLERQGRGVTRPLH